ncbi:hypothetical protein LTR97_009262 [Elasticomyces elasticus]|uniref:IF4E-domain-containing protein n=1 Tax=Elasticomyces elasticus TaxID=574655 RepID=A0AAN7W3B2_9PEZI|nr:hypothetical protein LTR97_009262 [Elasticomyces elasticus]
MDKQKENNPSNLWTRRSKYGEPVPKSSNTMLTRHATTSSSSKLSVSVNKNSSDTPDTHSTPSAKRYTSSQSAGLHNKNNPFAAPLNTTSVASPTASGASSAFGLGSGAFASFGSAAKTPKTPSSGLDFGKSAGDKKQQQQQDTSAGSDKETSDKDTQQRRPPARKSISSIRPSTASSVDASLGSARESSAQAWPLRHTWVVYYRPPTSKTADYEKSIKPLCRISTVQDFWSVYTHLNRPSTLPTVSDYHFFRDGIRPVWEDEENRKGGKWTMKLKKGVVDRYWEDLLLAMIGDQFGEASDEVCGAVVSIRQGEDVFGIWTKNNGGRNVKIRETVKRVLHLPSDTEVTWRSHDDSIGSEKTRVDNRQERGGEKRRGTMRAEQKVDEERDEDGRS